MTIICMITYVLFGFLTVIAMRKSLEELSGISACAATMLVFITWPLVILFDFLVNVSTGKMGFS